MKTTVLEYLENGPLRHCASKPAVIDGEIVLTFAELAAKAKACAASIRSGAPNSKRHPIAVFMPKSADALVAGLAALYSGNFYVPIDVKSPPARLKAVLENLEPAVVLTTPQFQKALFAAGVSEQKIRYLTDSARPPAGEPLEGGWDETIDTDPVYAIYTSGSTGTPKGVVISHRGVIDYIDWARACFEINENSVIGSQSPFYFDNSTLDIYLCLATGATLVILPEHLFGFPSKLIPYLTEKGVNFIFWVPSVLVTTANQKALEGLPLPPLRHVLFAGEVMPARHLNYWRKYFPQAVFANLYGPTEITVDCTYYIVDREFSDDEAIPIGYPCRNTDILIINEQNQPVRDGEPGELCVRGSSLALGYWRNPEQTSRAFAQNPLNSRYPELIYRTGDLVYRNERGEIMFIGRKDFQIKHQGYRIELGEIEAAVLGLPEVSNACVLYNQSRKEITLFLEAVTPLSPAVLRSKLLDRVPKYMLPTVFHQLPELPRNANGKTDRQALTAMMPT